MWITLAIVSLAVLGPLCGADTRDGLDWAPDHFWLRRRPGPDRLRNAGSRGRAGGGRVSAGRHRSVPAAG